MPLGRRGLAFSIAISSKLLLLGEAAQFGGTRGIQGETSFQLRGVPGINGRGSVRGIRLWTSSQVRLIRPAKLVSLAGLGENNPHYGRSHHPLHGILVCVLFVGLLNIVNDGVQQTALIKA
jgi:hypothetical protein